MPTTFTVAIDWDIDGAFTGSDDITSFVRSVHTSNGLFDERDHVANIGVCTLVLDNSTRVFSPLNASGTYYGKLLPSRPVRIQATDGVTTWTIWRGFTRSFDPEAGSVGSLRTCTVQCEDILGPMQRARIALPLQENTTMDALLKLIGSEAFKSAFATGTVTIINRPEIDDWVKVGDITYTYRDTLTAAYHVLRSGDVIANLAAAINASDRTVDGVDLYHVDTVRHPYVNATLTAPSWGNGETNGYYYLGRTGQDQRAAAQLITRNGSAASVWFYINKQGTPDTLTATIVTSNGADPSDTLVHANATVTVAAAAIVNGWNQFTFPGSFDYSATHWLKLTYNGAESAVHYYEVSRTTDQATPGYATDRNYAGAWSHVFWNRDLSFWFGGLLTLTANARGTWGNSIALEISSDVITVSGAALAGGTDAPALLSYQAGRTTFPYAADQWSEQGTNALRAMMDAVENEPGLLWVARDGTLTAKDRQWQNGQTATAATITLNNTADEQVGILDDERIANHIVVAFTPRTEETNQIVARSSYVIAVPGRGDHTEQRWSRSTGLPNSGGAGALGMGTKVVRLSFIVPESGTLTGAKDLTFPVAGTAYTVNDVPDGSGFNYTSTGRIKVSWVILGNGIEVTFTNDATGTLYVRDFTVRGTRLVTYETKEIVREDETSIGVYGRRTLRVAMPLINDENLATAYANWLLGRYKNPAYVVQSVHVHDAALPIGGVHPLSVEIGSVAVLSETQTGVSSARVLVQGIDQTIEQGGAMAQVAYRVRPLGDVTYWILGDATYGVLGSTTRLGI